MKHTGLASLILGAFALSTAGHAAERQLSLEEGTEIHVSANAAGTRVSFDLAGLVWSLNPGDGRATALTTPAFLARRPALAPDGKRLVYEKGLPGERQLELIELETDNRRLLTFGNFDHQGPRWHPDGRRLLFASNRGGNFGIWELDTENLNIRQWTFDAGDEKDPAWDARGEGITFVAKKPQGDTLFVQGEDGVRSRILTVENELHSPSWRPDGSLLTYVYRAPGLSELRMIILSEPPVIKPLTQGENVFASPAHWVDRNTFLYAADGRIRRRRFDDFSARDLGFKAPLAIPAGQPVRKQRQTPAAGNRPVRGITGFARIGDRLFVSALGSLWELGADGGVLQQFGAGAHLDTQLTASPDGRHLAFSSDRSGSLQIWLMSVATGEFRQLTQETGQATDPAWHPNSEALAYLHATQPAGRERQLKRIALDAAAPILVARGLPAPSAPAWDADGSLLLAPDGSGLVAWGTDDRPRPLPPGLPPAPELLRWSPDGRHLAWVEGGRLLLASRDAAGLPGDPRELAATGASQPRWLDGGRLLGWLDTEGLRQQAPEAEASQSVPVGLRWEFRAPPEDSVLVLRAGRVFDGLGPGYEYAQDIVIEGGRIKSMGPWRDPAPGPILDARDLTVIPGLFDLAVQGDGPRTSAEGRAWLAHGVTGIREFARDTASSLERRESWAAGQRPGPRLFAAVRRCATPARQVAMARQLEAVAIELCPSQSSADQRQLIELASKAGMVTVAPTVFPGALLGAGEIRLLGEGGSFPAAANRFIYGDVIEIAGAGSLSTVSGLAPVALPALARSQDLEQDPVFQALLSPAERAWYLQSWQAQAERYGAALRAEQRTAGQSIFRAVARGARVIPGTGTPAVPAGLGLQAELRLLQESGLQAFQVLRMATRDAARNLGLEEELGGIGPGRQADLVLVRGDPLKNLEDAARVEATLLNGRVYRRDELLKTPGVGKIYTP